MSKKTYQENKLEAEKILQNNPALAAAVAHAYAEKHGYLLLSKKDDSILRESGAWNLYLNFFSRKNKKPLQV